MSGTISRREAVKVIGLGALGVSLGCAASGSAVAQDPRPDTAPAALAGPQPYGLPPLTYGFDALAPVLDERIVHIHYSEHTAGYVRGLNATLKKLEAARESGDFTNVRPLSRDLAFHGSGVVLHTLYWNSLDPGGPREPGGALRAAIDRDFGSFAAFRKQLAAASNQVEGNGWGILAYEPVGRKLLVLQAENHHNLTIWGVVPLLAIDVWEHAYYLQYENRRSEYVDRILTIIDWPSVAARYDDAVA
jgi:Fe-Mn family superoxide dismutase